MLFPALLSAQTITVGVHTGPPYTVNCTTSSTGTLSFISTGTFNAGNIFRVELSNTAGAFPTYPLFVGTLALSGVNPSGTINLSISAGLAPSAAYRLRIVSTNPVATSGNTAAFTINNAASPCTNGQLIVNEISQGAISNQEYIELLVMGATPCSVVDIRRMIVDDNNGDYSGGAQAGAGIAAGHIRFDNSVYWERVLSGTLILLYNGAVGEKNTSIGIADDPTDTNLDMVFVISVTASGVTTGMEGTSTLPTSANAAYSPVTYGNTNWSQISLANTDDAAQTRTSSAVAMHGLSWGTPLMVAGPGVFMGTATTSGQSIYNNSTSSWTATADFNRANVPSFETPGMANTANNMILIGNNTCTVLPSTFVDFGLYKSMQNTIIVSWQTENENNVEKYFVERSVNGVEFEELTWVFAYNNSGINEYQITDMNPFSSLNYYRIVTKDRNGDAKKSKIKSININGSQNSTVLFAETDDFFNLTLSDKIEEAVVIQIQSITGQAIFSQKLAKGSKTLVLSKNSLPQGVLIFSIITKIQIENFKKINIHQN